MIILNKADILSLEREIFNLNALLDIAKVLGSTLKIEEVLEILANTCFGQFTCDKAVIFLPKDIDDSTFVIRKSSGYDQDLNIEIKDEGNHEIRNYFTKNTNAMTINNMIDSKECEKFIQKTEILNSVVVSPFIAKQKFIGLLLLGNKLTNQEYTDEELKLLTVLSQLTGVAVENARLYEEATTDRLTKLNNRHFFLTQLTDEINNSFEKKKNLSLIMVDIDHFKNVNDTYGHLQGDIILKELSFLFKKYFNQEYTTGRYGGEEFVILLRDTNDIEAVALAEGFRKTVEYHDFTGPNDKPMHITISLGVSTLRSETIEKELCALNNINSPSEGVSILSLESLKFIKKADKALYSSKRDGRNSVTLYSDNLEELFDENDNTITQNIQHQKPKVVKSKKN